MSIKFPLNRNCLLKLCLLNRCTTVSSFWKWLFYSWQSILLGSLVTITILWVDQPLGPGKFFKENVIASEWFEQGTYKPPHFSHLCFLKVLLDVASGDSPEIKADADWPGGSREGRRSFTTDQRQGKAATTLPVQLPCTLGSLCRIKVNTIKVKFGNCNFFHWLYFCPDRIGNVPMSK